MLFGGRVISLAVMIYDDKYFGVLVELQLVRSIR